MPGEMHEQLHPNTLRDRRDSEPIIPVTGGDSKVDKDLQAREDYLKYQNEKNRFVQQAIENDSIELKYGLELIDKVEGDVQKETREDLRTVSSRILLSGLMENRDVLGDYIEKHRSAHPFDDREALGLISFWNKKLETLGQSKEVGKEGKLWIKRLKRDFIYWKGQLNVNVGVSASCPSYHDFIQQLDVMSQQRNYFTTEDMENAFSEELKGLEYTPDEKKMIKERKIGLDFGNSSTADRPQYFKNEDLELEKQFGEETVGLKEASSKWNSEAFRWRMIVASIGQYDPNAETSKFSFMEDNLNDNDYMVRFVRQIFISDLKNPKQAVLDEFPDAKEITYLNIFSSDESINNERKYTAIMETLLTHNVMEKINLLSQTTDEKKREDKFGSLVKEVVSAYSNRLENWNSDDFHILSKLANVIVRSGVAMDKAFMTAREYLWHYSFIARPDGLGGYQPIRREGDRESGSIYSTWDLTSSFFGDRSVRYDEADNARSPIFPPSNDTYRHEWRKQPPNYQPRLDKAPIYDIEGNKVNEISYLEEDGYLNNLREQLFGRNTEFLKEFELEKFDDDIIDFLKQNEWRWTTCWWNDPVKHDYNLALPIYFPQNLTIENFWNSFTDEPGKKIFRSTTVNKKGESIWRRMIKGEISLKDLNYGETKSKQYDRWLVDMSMLGRYVRFMTETLNPNDPLWTLTTDNPSSAGIKKIANYIRLTFRDSEDDPTKYEIAYCAFMFVKATADKFNIYKSSSWDRGSSPETQSNADRFILAMNNWKKNILWLTARRTNSGITTTNYGKQMAALATYYTRILFRMGKSSAEEIKSQTKSGYDKDLEWFNKKSKVLDWGKLDKNVKPDIVYLD